MPAFLQKAVFTQAFTTTHTSEVVVNLRLLVELVIAMIAISIVVGAFGVFQSYLSTQVGQSVMHDLRTSVYRHLQRLSLAFFTKTRTGEVQSRIANDIGGVDNVLTSTATSVMSTVTTVIATVIAMFLIQWELAVVALGLMPIFVLITRRVGETRRRDLDDAAGVDGRHLLARRGVALGLGDPAREDDGPLDRARDAVRGRVRTGWPASRCAAG